MARARQPDPAADEHALVRFLALVEDRLGLRIEDHRWQQVRELVARRSLARKAATVDRYLDGLARPAGDADQEEWRRLATELTIGETYFFRHAEQLAAFAEVALPGAREVLSAACSSGEEPYTLAILAAEHAPTAKVAITAVDVDPAALARARRAHYEKWSLRATAPEIAERYFTHDRAVVETIRARVTFVESNLVTDDDPALWAAGRWDTVFCRNAIMYLSPAHQDRVFDKIARALVPGGYLFLGHAETLRDRAQFELCQSHSAFYFRKRSGAVAVAVPVADAAIVDPLWSQTIAASSARVDRLAGERPAATAAGSGPATAAGSGPATAAGSGPATAAGSGPATAAGSGPATAAGSGPVSASGAASSEDLAAIDRLLADERFAEAGAALAALPPSLDVHLLRALVATHANDLPAAEAHCEAALALDPRAAPAHYLIAQARQSSGEPELATYHARRAADCDPTFAMAPLMLGLLARRANDRAAAHAELTRALAAISADDPRRLARYGGGLGPLALAGLCRAELAQLGVGGGRT